MPEAECCWTLKWQLFELNASKKLATGNLNPANKTEDK